jgi:hypothetical protein
MVGTGGGKVFVRLPTVCRGWQIFPDFPGRQSEAGSLGVGRGVFVRLPTVRRGVGKYCRIFLLFSGGRGTLLLRVRPLSAMPCHHSGYLRAPEKRRTISSTTTPTRVSRATP